MRQRIFFVLACVVALAAWAAPRDEMPNLIPNEGFEDGVPDPWVFYGQVAFAMANRNDAYEGTEALQITVAAAGVNFWDSGVQYRGAGQPLVFEQGVTYTWAFFMKADHPVNVNIKPELAQDPWTGYGERQVLVTEEYQEFWTTWQTPQDVIPAQLTLHVAFDAATLWMDAPRWYEGEYIPYEEWIGEVPQAVNPVGKLTVTWGALKGR
ncbi:MAG: hypothetical protein KatS3mg115_1123 [Candidatus Poribacteria bacterium]|nr:MAG: hypothetical protein KatS3mg115_1123 [Candidatus Poribacteria bacterium]